MNKNQEILRAYLTEQLQAAGFEPDASALDALTAHIALREGQSDEAGEVRSVDIKEDTGGKVTAEHFSLYNLIDVKFYDLFGLGIDAFPIMLMAGMPALQIAYAVLKLTYEFYPKLTYEFNETDAKILLAIYRLEKKEFTLQEVLESFNRQFGEPLDEARFSRAVGFFHKKDILRYKGDGIYQARERMTYERD